MAQLIVRNIEDNVKEMLVNRAKRHGHSMEEEVRSILRKAVSETEPGRTDSGFGTRLAHCFAAMELDGLELLELDEEAQAADFNQ